MSWPPRRSSVELALAAGGAALVIGLAIMVSVDLTDGFDGTLIGLIRSSELLGLFAPLRVITELGSTVAVSLVALLALAVGAAIRMWRTGLVGAITIALASIANSTLKIAIARQRPELLDPIIVEHGFSFPSGHSALGMVAYGVLAVLVHRSSLPAPVRAAGLFMLGALVALIGLSRVYLGVHYPTDVIAGWSAGAVVVLVFAAITRRALPAPGGEAAGVDPAARRSDPPGST
jgi:membrane-associated phospholipid phosphatase